MYLNQIRTVAELLAAHPAQRAAIGAPGRPDMTREQLRQAVAMVGGALRGQGIRQQDAVAMVMPNGPEMAVLFPAVACWAIAAPLNAAYREDEFDFYLGDLDAKAVIVMSGQDSPARAVAAKRGIAIIELSPDTGGPSGVFTLSVPCKDAENPQPIPDDVALLLHTSGTTSRPKIVPLSHRNLTASARNIAGTLALSPEDHCLVIMPLFHIHGLVGALLSSLWAGASVFCPPGFNALKFYSWLDESDATWYTAVPTMHQAILSRADRNAEVIRKQRLR